MKDKEDRRIRQKQEEVLKSQEQELYASFDASNHNQKAVTAEEFIIFRQA